VSLRARARSEGERGSLAIELVLAAPLILLMLALVFAYGRMAQAQGTLEIGVRDAARSATQARSLNEARDVAKQVIEEELLRGASSCYSSYRRDPQVLIRYFTPGFPVVVTAYCDVSLDDLGLPGAPGTVRITSVFSSWLDPNRGVAP
jgi:Flp pilus assembly protein TadG